jgi:hypothetical protein
MLARSHDVPKFILLAFIGGTLTHVEWNVFYDFFLVSSVHMQADWKVASSCTLAPSNWSVPFGKAT